MDADLIVIAEFAAASGLSREEIVELVDYGALDPLGGSPEDWAFPSARSSSRAARRVCGRTSS